MRQGRRAFLISCFLLWLFPLSAQAAEHTHVYDLPEYHWSDRAPYTCSVTLTCTTPNCPEPVLTRKCTVTTQRIAPTCTEDGAVAYTASFQLDGDTFVNPETKSTAIPKTGHAFQFERADKATPTLAGLLVNQCDNCGERKVTEIASPKKLTLSRTTYSYNGKSKKPSGTVTDSAGKVIGSSHYTLVYPRASSKVGTYSVSVAFRGARYSGTLSDAASFSVLPRSTALRAVKARSKGFSLRWTRRKTQVTGYQISYAVNKNFKKAKTKKITKNAVTSTVIARLSPRKTYYVRIRTYKTVTGSGTTKTYYSVWSPVRTIKTKP